MSEIRLQCPDSDPLDQSVVPDILLRQEPDEEEDDEGDGKKDEDDDREDDGYSE